MSENPECLVIEDYEIASACWGDVAALGTEACPIGAIGHPTADAEDRALDDFPAQLVSRFKWPVRIKR